LHQTVGLNVIASDAQYRSNGSRRFGSSGKPNEFRFWDHEKAANDVFESSMNMLYADYVDAGQMPVVLANKFGDYEPGIHWIQCQMQSGTTSINTNRIYNPIKQGKDHDPQGKFIKKWIPELKDISLYFIHEPWLLSRFNQEEYEQINYIRPIIDIPISPKTAKKKIQEITKKDGYWDISNEIYLKHGSRKRLRKNKDNKKIISPEWY